MLLFTCALLRDLHLTQTPIVNTIIYLTKKGQRSDDSTATELSRDGATPEATAKRWGHAPKSGTGSVGYPTSGHIRADIHIIACTAENA